MVTTAACSPLTARLGRQTSLSARRPRVTRSRRSGTSIVVPLGTSRTSFAMGCEDIAKYDAAPTRAFCHPALQPAAARQEPLRHADQHDRNVVASAVLIGDIDQLGCRLGQIAALGRDDFLHRVGVDHVGQPVGAEHIDVLGLDPVLGDVGRHHRLDAERPRDQVLVQRVLGLLRRQHAAVDLLLQQRVIVGQLLELVGAQAIAARIADVPDADAVREEDGRHQRRAHARAFGATLRRFVDALVGQRDLLLQQRGRRASGRCRRRPWKARARSAAPAACRC